MLRIPDGLKIRGPPKRRWSKHRKLVEIIFMRGFPKWNQHTAREIVQSGVPKSTLYEWLHHYQQDPDWRPYATNRSQDRRLFTNAEERAMSEFIITNFTLPGKLFTDEDFKDLALHAWHMKKGEGRPNFSNGLIWRFKLRNEFSSRKAHPKKRPSVTSQEKEAWRQQFTKWLRGKPLDRVVNIDETCWRLVPNNLKTWSPKGSNSVQINTLMNEKMSMTVICAITAAHTKLPMTLVVKGKSNKTLQSIGDVSPHRAEYTETGWISDTLFMDYLVWLRQFYRDVVPISVLLDCYSIHRRQDITAFARDRLNFHFQFIPGGCTDDLQPLDRAVFGSLEATAKRLWRLMDEKGERERMGKKEMIQILIPAWEKISPLIIRAGWRVFDSDSDEEEDCVESDDEEDDE